jgi:hypothetical protein
MIYQLKIKLNHTSPPIWRRLQLDGKTTFAELHRVIQIAFDWEDYHLHEFLIKAQNGTGIPGIPQFLQEKISIGGPDGHEFDFGEEKLDEQEEIVEDHLKKEKDKCLYVYDFGDDWQHEIVVEKVIPPEPGVAYPYCLKAMRETPEEDSRGLSEEAPPETTTDNKKLAASINSDLAKYQRKLVDNEKTGEDKDT